MGETNGCGDISYTASGQSLSQESAESVNEESPNMSKSKAANSTKTVQFREDIEVVAEFSVELPKITVRDPVTHDTWEQGKFTTYQICIRTAHPSFHLRVSSVRRRFSELIWLDNLLRSKNRDAKELPQAPPKQVFSDRFNPRFLKNRMRAMEDYLNQLLLVDKVLSDNALHLFIQTDLTTTEMSEYFKGILPESLVTDAWANMGHMHSSCALSNTPLPEEPQEIVMSDEDCPATTFAATSTMTTTTTTTTTNNSNNNSTRITMTTTSRSSCCSSGTTDSGMGDSEDANELGISPPNGSGMSSTRAVEIASSTVLGESAWASQLARGGYSDAESLTRPSL